MTLEEELKCEGLLGFGAGYALGKQNVKPTEMQTLDIKDNHCASHCAISKSCLGRHRTKCRLMFPNATKSFDKLCDKGGQAKATRLWREMYPQAPLEPYLTQMLANLQDGFAFATKGKVEERGRLTLGYPVAA